MSKKSRANRLTVRNQPEGVQIVGGDKMITKPQIKPEILGGGVPTPGVVKIVRKEIEQ